MTVSDEWRSWWGIETFGEPDLERMLTESTAWLTDLRGRRNPRWLTLSGRAGVGKTHVARRVKRWWTHCGCFVDGPNGANLSESMAWAYWPRVMESMKGGDFSWRTGLRDHPLVIIDDLGGTNDKSGFAEETAFSVLNSRLGKWTLITTNLKLGEIAGALNERVASRLVRAGNRFVRVETQDYGVRTYQR